MRPISTNNQENKLELVENELEKVCKEIIKENNNNQFRKARYKNSKSIIFIKLKFYSSRWENLLKIRKKWWLF